MSAHAKYSPSDSSRWIHCTGAIALCDELPQRHDEPEDPESPSAVGTRAHELAAHCLEQDLDPHNETNDIEMANHITNYIKVVKEYAVGARLEVEQRLDISALVEGMFGTADIIIYDEVNKHLKVIDLKYGQGVAVVAEDNPQLMLYAVGAIYNCAFDVRSVEMMIYQPRVFDGLPALRVHEITRRELRVFEKQVRAAICKQDSGELTPGDKQCRWCEAAPTCKALQAKALEMAAAEFDPFKTKDVSDMTVEIISESMQYVNLIQHWCKQVEAKAQELLEHGHAVEGFKLVRGRSNRRWLDPVAALITLEAMETLTSDDIFTRKLVSPTQFQKLVDKDTYVEVAKDQITIPEGKLTIAKASDKRPSINPFDEFKD